MNEIALSCPPILGLIVGAEAVGGRNQTLPARAYVSLPQ